MKKHIPNLVTSGRILFAILVFMIFMKAAAIPVGERSQAPYRGLIFLALGVFILSGLSDFLDGWLARRLNVQSTLGAALDPVADKIALVAAIFGLTLIKPQSLVWPGFLMLSREFLVAGLREGGVSLPVSFLAKCKTSLQFLGLSLVILSLIYPQIQRVSEICLWLAVLITLWTGGQYLLIAVKSDLSKTGKL